MQTRQTSGLRTASVLPARSVQLYQCLTSILDLNHLTAIEGFCDYHLATEDCTYYANHVEVIP